MSQVDFAQNPVPQTAADGESADRIRQKESWRDKLDFGFGREVSIRQVLKTLTWRRLWNAVKILSSFILSGISRRNIVWGVPPIVNIEPTNICNLRCPLCITGSKQMKRPYGRMDFAMFKKMIDQVADRIIYVTLYHQGEPYLHPSFNEFVAYAKQKGVYVTTSTNAHYFDEAMADEVVRSGLDSMIISLDGVTQQSYAHYRRGGDLDKVLDGVRNLVAARKRLNSRTPYLFLQFLVMKHNEHEIPAIRSLASSLGVDRLLIKTTQVMTLEEAREWLPENERYRRYSVTADEFTVKRGGKGLCPRLWLTTLIDWDGQVVPCCFDKNGEWAMGDLRRENNFLRIWQDEKYNSFRRQMLKDRNAIDICRNCNYGIGIFK